MNAWLSLLLACALLSACGQSDVDPSYGLQEQQLAHDQQPASEQQRARDQGRAPEQQPAPDWEPPQAQQAAQAQQPAQGQPGAQGQQSARDQPDQSASQERPPAQDQPPPRRPSRSDRPEAPQPDEPTPTAPEPTTAEQELASAEQQPLFSPTPATVVRETELKAQPSLDARTLTTLPEESAVIIVDRRGGWFDVLHDEDTRGWVRLLHVSSQPPGTHGPIPPELERAARIATGRAGEGNVAATTGTRGLTEEELREAEADAEELSRMEALGADPAQAEAYAREHHLARRTVPYPAEARVRPQ